MLRGLTWCDGKASEFFQARYPRYHAEGPKRSQRDDWDSLHTTLLNCDCRMNKFSSRERSVLTGLYLSKFDLVGLEQLGFNGFTEAFNILGHALGIRPASVKNYRDEFDPLYPNDRKGWHNRPMREYCRAVFDSFGDLTLEPFTRLLKEAIYKDHSVDYLMETIAEKQGTAGEGYAKRLLTGQAAEQYFKSNYKKIDIFSGFDIEDTTRLGCGFDFRLVAPDTYYAVEVKGLSDFTGNITLTDKEHSVGEILGSLYFLFVVKNFKEEPIHEIFRDPLAGKLNFSQVEHVSVETSWVARV